VLQTNPTDFATRANLASVYRTQGNYAQAVAQFEALVGQQPNEPRFLAALADAYNEAGRFDSAIATSQRLLSVSPGNGSAYVTWAKALESRGASLQARAKAAASGDLYDQAIASYQAAIEKLQMATRDSTWRSHAQREIARQEKLIEIAQQEKLRQIWDQG